VSHGTKKRLLPILSIIPLLVSGCARQEYPPGGPEDRTPPKILITSPETGTANVTADARIRIEFSEPIDRSTVEKAVFISPQPNPPPEIKAKRDAIEITPKVDWSENTTYVITLGTDLKDAHNVNLEQSTTIAFATGPTVDSGSISGTVYKDGKETRGVSIALFTRDPGQLDMPVDSVPPDYQTQSGEGGAFVFEYLPPKPFYLVAFKDRNRNRRIDFGRELIGLPYTWGELSPDRNILENLGIQLHSSDTAVVGFRSVSINSDGLLKLRFTKSLDADEAKTLFAAMTLTTADTGIAQMDIIDYTPLSRYPSSDFLFITGDIVSETQYRVSFDLGVLYPAIDDSARVISYSFSAQRVQDKTPPTFLEICPADRAVNVHPDSLIILRASEPLDMGALDDAVWIINGEEDTTGIEIDAENRFLYTGSPKNGLGFGNDYRWFLIESLIQDRSGNSLGDSIRSFTFSTVGRDTLGTISGEIRFSRPEDTACPVILSFNPTGRGTVGNYRVPAGSSRFRTELLPGYYSISAFLDRNNNGDYDFGSLIPYRLAEPFTVQADTIRVRTRFESTGVIVEF